MGYDSLGIILKLVHNLHTPASHPFFGRVAWETSKKL